MSDLFTDMEQELGFAGGGIYFHLYQTSGDLSHLNHALEVWQGAIGEMASDSAELPMCLNLLSYGLSARYERKHNLADLDEAARLLERGISDLARSAATSAQPLFVPAEPFRAPEEYRRSESRYSRLGGVTLSSTLHSE
jgi:hypothetical protein